MKIVRHLCSASGIEAGKQVSITAGETSLMDDAEAARWIEGGLAVLHEDQKSKPTHDRSKATGLAGTGRSAAPRPDKSRPGTPPGGGSIPPGGASLDTAPAPDAGDEEAADQDAADQDAGDPDAGSDPDADADAGDPEDQGDPKGETGEESQVPPKLTRAQRRAAKAAAKAAGKKGN